MFRVVNGSGTAGRSRLDLGGIQMAGKTGTAQVAKLVSRGSVGAWKTRDHALFICYAPTDRPRYAMAVVIEHGTFGARAAAPIAKDVMTFLFDPAKAWDSLLKLEQSWGGTAQERLDARYDLFVSQYGVSAPKVAPDATKDGDAAADGLPPQPQAVQTVVQNVDAPEPLPTVSPAPPPPVGPGPAPAASAAPTPATPR